MIQRSLDVIIELSQQLLAVIETVASNEATNDTLEQLTILSNARDKAIKTLFNEYSHEELAPNQERLQKIADIDQQLQQTSQSTKAQMAQQVIKQKKNTKAASAYLK
ncbi:hypothetical protein [Psychrobium sp. 1_MG-2023]|uniref:hypothetical protein n=1 Tax=Psychrobium sp. 1_MG-2023 TaxID=3062624 RepID=UPI000C33FFA6|nr:hypothetical protein [Psychrobium sp. 1_MG-2023]MDP2559844.1 hypothetical protein [Psychrobium sp. 1_MG-2023]PKF59052.1 hypothetical protein CW748_02365 [Alteromonadales bacterium alter-6D02]